MQGFSWITGGPDLPTHLALEKPQQFRFDSTPGPELLKTYKATKPIFNVGLSVAYQRNAISMAFGWESDDDVFWWYLDSIP